MFELKQLIESGEMLDIFFQPIFAASNPRLIGYEALLRVKNSDGGYINPLLMFEFAKKYDLSIELDRAAREASIKKFASLNTDPNAILFLNFESDIIDKGVVGSGKILEVVNKYGVSPSKIAIEIKEDAVKNSNELARFCEIQKKNGFLIALDDVGTEASNIARFNIVKPHIVKLDKSLIRDVDKDHYNANIVNFMINLCHSTGALVLAEGVETNEEAMELMTVGIDLLQGYYFARPAPIPMAPDSFNDKISALTKHKQKYAIEKSDNEQKLFDGLSKITKPLVKNIATNLQMFDKHAFEILTSQKTSIEAVYLLKSCGKLLFDTATNVVNINPLFAPGLKNDDYSASDYFYTTMNSHSGKFLTQPYISKASGHICVTFACRFLSEEETYILCVDFVIQEIL